ncbi:RNA polymerase sigma factor [Streptomyces sp. NPDC059752]|uniref:RNA polymerase sigma factor n=1 Tax=unclassified Streptomyces TaxID=2593676 RepID=UPI003660966D
MRHFRSYQKVLGEPPTDLSPVALKQWQQVQGSAGIFHRRISARVGASHADDVLAKALVNWHDHLRRRGPVEQSPLAYFAIICRNEGTDHLDAMTKLAEQYIEDTSSSLDDEAQRVHVIKNGLTQIEDSDLAARALKLLSSELSQRELTAWVLRVAYEIDCATIAEHLETTSTAVRKAMQRARDKLESPLVQKKLRAWELAPE